MTVVVDHLLIHKCEKGGREGVKERVPANRRYFDEGDRFLAIGAIISI